MQEFTASETAALRTLENVAVGVRAFSSSRDGLSADRCQKIVDLLTKAPPVPTPSLRVQDHRAVATLAMFGEVLDYISREVTDGSLGAGLPLGRSRTVNRMADMVHNLPSILAGTHWALRFDERWLLARMRAFDRSAGTRLEATYQAALAPHPAQP